MRKVFLLFILLFFMKGYSQAPEITDKVWKLTRITAISQHESTFYYPPSNSEIEHVYFTISENEGVYSFETSVCESLSGSLNIDDSSFAIENASVSSNSCTDQENTSFNDTYFDIFFEGENFIDEPFHINHSVNSSGEEYFMFGNNYYTVDFELSHLSVDKASRFSLTLYPNPAKENLHIQNSSHTVDQIQVFNISGQKIKTFKNVKGQVDISELQNGVYFFRINSGKNSTVKKVIKN